MSKNKHVKDYKDMSCVIQLLNKTTKKLSHTQKTKTQPTKIKQIKNTQEQIPLKCITSV